MSGLRIGVFAVVCAALSLAIILPAARPAPQPAPQAPAPLANDPKLIEDLVYANRILYPTGGAGRVWPCERAQRQGPEPFSDVAQYGAGARHVEGHHGV